MFFNLLALNLKMPTHKSKKIRRLKNTKTFQLFLQILNNPKSLAYLEKEMVKKEHNCKQVYCVLLSLEYNFCKWKMRHFPPFKAFYFIIKYILLLFLKKIIKKSLLCLSLELQSYKLLHFVYHTLPKANRWHEVGLTLR